MTHHLYCISLLGKHLHRYVAEHEFRYNTDHDAPARIARCLIGSHGRLRLRELFA
jgi:hypothetical protein